ncbi:MAG: aquaporin family protein [Alphaproteobacteria bacterium]|nr:aquaporin family protein [Alphaproteobacteria bacterium]
MTAPSIAQKLAAEAIGAALLLAAIVGSGILAVNLADGNAAVALLANSSTVGAILVVLVVIFGPVSGAHFNPAVTLAFLIRQEIGAKAALMYVTAQILGAVAGVLLAHAMFELPYVQIGAQARTGPGQFIGEIVATFGLLATIFGAIAYRSESVPGLVGLYIAAAIWFTSSTCFANPAVTIARTITDTFVGIRPIDAPAFVVAQLAAAALAAFAAHWLFPAPPVDDLKAFDSETGMKT